jgi:hypothetical protein
MPPALDPKPVRILENLATALALIAGGADYYHTASFAGIGKQITNPQPLTYPCTFIAEPGEVGQFSEQPEQRQVLWHGSWYWEIPIFGVIHNAGMTTDAAYKSLLKLAADIYRAVMVDHTRGGLAHFTEVRGWTVLGPQEQTDGRPWVGVLVGVHFRTDDQQMET